MAKLRFKDLSVGEVFVFGSEHDPRLLTSGMAKGPWIKNSSRTYEHVDDVGKPTTERRYGGGRIVVGSVNVDVVRVERTSLSCPNCGESSGQCPECGAVYEHGTAGFCVKPSCMKMNAPVDCSCGMVVSHDAKGIITPEGDFRKFLRP